MGASDNLSSNLLLLRRSRRLSQASFAQELGISKSTLQEIEQGHSPTLDTLECISTRLSIPACVLIADAPVSYQASFLLHFLHGSHWLQEWSDEDLELLWGLSSQLMDLLRKYLRNHPPAAFDKK